MHVIELMLSKPLLYGLTGKFRAPSADWIHDDVPLTDYELIVVTEGTLYLTYHNENFTVSKGSFLLLPPLPSPDNRRKGFRSSKCSFYWMHFTCSHEVNMFNLTNSSLEQYSQTINSDALVIPRMATIPNPAIIVVLMKQLQDAVRSEYSSTILNYMTTLILCDLHNQFQINTTPQQETKPLYNQMYHSIVDYVKQNSHKALKVSDISNHFGYNEKYLSHLFSSIAGFPLKQLILTTKVEAANYMLVDTNKTILEIAYTLGFTDNHAFSKVYKKVSGITPSDYRNAFSKRLLYEK